jgi:hypothetical protein
MVVSIVAFFCFYLPNNNPQTGFKELVTKVKPSINSVEVRPQQVHQLV